jgi:lysophospholipid hydrolase
MTDDKPQAGNNDLVAFVTKTNLFGKLDDAVLGAILAESERITVTAGETLLEQGDDSQALYVVISGQLLASIRETGGEEIVVGEVYAGEPIGEMEIMAGAKYQASVRAAIDTELLQISKPAFERVASENPLVLTRIHDFIVQRMLRNLLATMLTNLFGPVDQVLIQEIETTAEWVQLSRDEALMRTGEPGDSMYLLVTGRLRAAVSVEDGDEKVVGEIEPGELVGEMEIITGEPRAASVYADRDALLLKFSREVFKDLSGKYPQLVTNITLNVINRLRKVTLAEVSKSDMAAALGIVLVPASPSVPIDEVGRRLGAALEQFGPTLVLSSERLNSLLSLPDAAQITADDPNDVRITVWLNDQEIKRRFILYIADPVDSPWTRRGIRQADQLVVVASANDNPELSPIETQLLHGTQDVPSLRQTLVLLQPDGLRLPTGTKRWLSERQVSMHHHLRLGQAADFERLARILARRAVGLVLSGGAARGFAHIGVLRALNEAGIHFDYVGGASAGSIMAAQIAMGLDHETMLADTVTKTEALLPPDYTFPLISVTQGAKWTSLLKSLVGDTQIEDLWLGFYCVSVNISRAELVTHGSGSLFRAVRASSALPGIVPPLSEGQDLLVDGGLFNNLPVDVMKDQYGVHSIFAVDISAPVELQLTSPIDFEISGWKLLWQRLNPFQARPDYPSIIDIVVRSTIASGIQSFKRMKALADFYIRLPVESYKTMDWDKGNELAEIGYRHTQQQIETWRREGKL